MTADLVAFLRARLDEDERLARDAARHCAALIAAEASREGLGFYAPPYSDAGAEWSSDADHVYAHDPRPEQPKSEIADFGCGASMLTPHVQNNSPVRVLAEVDAKRRIIDACGWAAKNGGGSAFVLPVLRLLALPFADHPDYQPEWAPEA